MKITLIIRITTVLNLLLCLNSHGLARQTRSEFRRTLKDINKTGGDPQTYEYLRSFDFDEDGELKEEGIVALVKSLYARDRTAETKERILLTLADWGFLSPEVENFYEELFVWHEAHLTQGKRLHLKLEPLREAIKKCPERSAAFIRFLSEFAINVNSIETAYEVVGDLDKIFQRCPHEAMTVMEGGVFESLLKRIYEVISTYRLRMDRWQGSRQVEAERVWRAASYLYERIFQWKSLPYGAASLTKTESQTELHQRIREKVNRCPARIAQ